MNGIRAYVAGKSGGHLIPCLTLAQQYKQHPNNRVVFFSTQHPLDKRLIAGNPIVDVHITHHLPSVNYRNPINLIATCWRSTKALVNSINALKKQRVTRVVTTGGYNAIPVCLAAWLLRIPIELWELNVEPGKAIRILAPIAETIHCCFAQTQTYLKRFHCQLTNYPVRYAATDRLSPVLAREKLGLTPHRFTLFILGGSQGSHTLNETMRQIIEHDHALASRVQCIHQTGAHESFDWAAWYAHHAIPAVVFAYRDDVATLFSAADLVITRAGAGALFELAFFNKPALIFPLQAATTSHQILNAHAFAQQYPHTLHVIEPKQQRDWATIARLISET